MKNVCRKIASLCAVIALLTIAMVTVSLAQQVGGGAGGAHPYSTGQHAASPGIPNWARNGTPYVQMYNNTGNCLAGSAQSSFGPFQLYPMGLQSQSLVWQNAWMQDFGGVNGADPWSWYGYGSGQSLGFASGSPGSLIAPYQSCGANLQPGFESGW